MKNICEGSKQKKLKLLRITTCHEKSLLLREKNQGNEDITGNFVKNNWDVFGISGSWRHTKDSGHKVHIKGHEKS